MKILLYNWVNFDDVERRGGGVRVYHSNLVAELTKIPGARVYTLSSGIRYDLFNRRVYIRKRPGKDGVASFEVVNSPIAAPAHAAFYSLDDYLHDRTLKKVIQDFLETHGPFDVIQFDNLEGLTAGVLELKERFPQTRFIYYMHNYNLVCPQVNLWFMEATTCDDYNDGKRCSVCLPHHINMREVKIAHAISAFLQRIGIAYDSFLFRMIYKHLPFAKRLVRLMRRLTGGIHRKKQATPRPSHLSVVPERLKNSIYSSRAAGSIYQQYRARNVLNANNNFDCVLAVSNRVREIAVQFGIAEQKVSVAYIGSQFANEKMPIRVRESDHLKIAYLGYERKDKGFYHFVDALEAIPRSAARRISVLIAAKLQSSGILYRLKRLSVEFRDFEIVNGYEHKTLKPLLADVDLGIVPVLWEDNLPQVAIEFVSHGVPVLSSELGGAKELCGANRKFVYRHGNVDDFINKILFFLDNRATLGSYADRGLILMDMERHVRIMVDRFYRWPSLPLATVRNRREVLGAFTEGKTP
jgi:glycosyltransferase involved in cell wall biosynthesis